MAAEVEKIDPVLGRLESCEARTDGTTATLCYASDEGVGYRRVPRGDGFAYFDPQGVEVRDAILLARFSELVIPPAWRDVWISEKAEGHIQATGRDARGRKQYIYHTRWEEARSITKFERMVPFGAVLPVIRKGVDAQLSRDPVSRDTMLAFAVRLLDETLIRVGNREYARQNDSYGLTTLRSYHVHVAGNLLQLKFRGKRGKEWELQLSNPRLARLARRYQELPGQHLLEYQDESGRMRVIDSGDVNEYLRRMTGDDFTAKDFRTWGGTVKAASELYLMGPGASETDAKKKVLQAVKRTASKLGNTPSTCRKYYIHPRIIEAFHDETLFRVMGGLDDGGAGVPSELRKEERAVLHLLTMR